MIKLGYDFNHVLDGIDSIYNGNGSYDYSSLLDFASDALAPSRCDANGSAVGTSPCYSYYTQQLGPQAFSFDTNDYAVFVSDEWKVKRRLTLSYGIRYEYEQLPPQNKLLPNPDLPQSNFVPRDRNNYGPRVGAAYDLTGHGNTVLRGGYGIYFGRIINSTIFCRIHRDRFGRRPARLLLPPRRRRRTFVPIYLQRTRCCPGEAHRELLRPEFSEPAHRPGRSLPCPADRPQYRSDGQLSAQHRSGFAQLHGHQHRSRDGGARSPIRWSTPTTRGRSSRRLTPRICLRSGSTRPTAPSPTSTARLARTTRRWW